MRFKALARVLIAVPLVPVVGFLALLGAPPQAAAESPDEQAETFYSAWMLESCTLVDYAVAALAPNRGVATHETVFNVPVNYNIIKGGGHIVAYDTGWKQQQYLSAFNCQHWAPVRDQMAPLGIAPEEVDMIVLGHAHWDHAGQVDEFPKATLFVQGEELRYVDWATSYPNPKISETVCGRRPACGYPPDIMDLIFRKIQNGQAHIVEGEETIAPGLTIHPVFKAHTRGSELLQVHTVQGEFVFGSDAYSVWTNIKEFEPANIQQADTVEQVLAYEKGVKIAGGFDHLLSAHEPLSYTEKYPVTSKSWIGANGSRGAELVLAPGEPSRLGRLPAPAASAAGVQTAPPAAVPAAGASAPAASAGGAVPAPAQIPR